MSLCKGVVRTCVIVALAGGATAFVAESVSPGSTRALMGQAKSVIAGAIDGSIEDPIALRAQLERLEAQYPAKISEVRSDLADVEEHAAELERELAVSERVVQLTSADLHSLDDGITRARAVLESSPHKVVRINFEERKMDLGGAYDRRTQIEQTRSVYQTRAEEIRTEMGFLSQQQGQLAELLGQLETERAQFQAQIVQLDAQIDSIARNDRLIGMMEERQARIDQLSSHEVHSLEQFQRRVERLRSEQQARLGDLARDKATRSYEDVARWELDAGAAEVVDIAPGSAPTIESESEVIETQPSASSATY